MQGTFDMSKYIRESSSSGGSGIPPEDEERVAAAKQEAREEETKKFIREYLKQQKKLDSNLEKIERIRARTIEKEKQLADRILLQDARIASKAANVRGAAMVKASAGGGGGGSALAAGALGGGVAGSIMVLVDILRKIINQSKIATAVSDTIAKLMGALIDYALLPFMPLLVDGLTAAADAILSFGSGWEDFTDSMKNEGIAGVLKLSAQWAWGAVEGYVKNFISWLFDGRPLTDKVIDMAFNLLAVLNPLSDLADKAMRFLFGDIYTKNVEFVIDLVKGAVSSFVNAAWSLITWIFGEAGQVKLDIGLNLLEQGSKAAWGIVDTITSGASGAINSVGGAVAGAGNAVAGASQQVVNIYGTLFKDENDMYASVSNRLRQEQYRYSKGFN